MRCDAAAAALNVEQAAGADSAAAATAGGGLGPSIGTAGGAVAGVLAGFLAAGRFLLGKVLPEASAVLATAGAAAVNGLLAAAIRAPGSLAGLDLMQLMVVHEACCCLLDVPPAS